MPERRRVIVTGGTGFIGRHVVRALLRKDMEVIVVGQRKVCDPLPAHARYIALDLLRSPDLDPIIASAAADTLIHLAWETRHGHFWRAAENLDWVAASLRLVKAFAGGGGRRIVGVGTCVEYRAPQRGPCIAGTTPIAPAHLYGAAKDAFHRVLAAYAGTCGLSYAWGRVFYVTGPEEPPARLVPSALRAIHAGEPFNTGSGERVRDFLDVRDCGAALATVAMSDFEGQLNISSGRPTTIAELLETLARLTNAGDLINIGKLPDRPDEPANLWGEASELHGAIGFKQRFTLKDSLAAVLECSRRAQPASP